MAAEAPWLHRGDRGHEPTTMRGFRGGPRRVLRRSTDGGASWGDRVVINDDERATNACPRRAFSTVTHRVWFAPFLRVGRGAAGPVGLLP